MSTYTTELRWVIEQGMDIGLKEYPIFDESYRDKLNKKIIEHYYFREIGFETVGLFKRFLNRKMNEIMPYYNQLYKSELIKIEPLTRIDLWEKFERVDDGEFTGEMHDGVDNFSIYSDTPQNMVQTELIQSNEWATNANKEHNSEETTTQQNTSNHLEHVKHNAGNDARRTDSEMLMEYRKTFLNIDMMIINELESCFMQIW